MPFLTSPKQQALAATAVAVYVRCPVTDRLVLSPAATSGTSRPVGITIHTN